jgi:hypothetical protein
MSFELLQTGFGSFGSYALVPSPPSSSVSAIIIDMESYSRSPFSGLGFPGRWDKHTARSAWISRRPRITRHGSLKWYSGSIEAGKCVTRAFGMGRSAAGALRPFSTRLQLRKRPRLWIQLAVWSAGDGLNRRTVSTRYGPGSGSIEAG